MSQIENLSNCKSLKRLSLIDNLVTKLENYRYFTIHKLPQLTVLDFQKVKLKERQLAEEIYGQQKEDRPLVEKRRKLQETYEPSEPLPTYLEDEETLHVPKHFYQT